MIYLDNAATSFPKPESVYQTLDRFARSDLANPGRAGHKMALAAERVLDDARQTAGVLPIDIQAANIDLLAFPGHKSLFGPTGTGALYVGPAAVVGAWREGGTGGDSSSETQPRDYPYFLEGGTPNVLGVAGLVAGIRYVMEQGQQQIHRREVELCERLWRRLGGIGGYEGLCHPHPPRRVG